MSNQQQQGGGAQQPGQPGQQIAPGLQAIPQLMVPPAARPILSGAPVVAGPGNPVTLTPQQLLLAQQQQQLLQAHFLQQMSQNPQLASMMRAQQQQALQAAQALKPGQFAPARLPMPALALAQTQAPGLKTAPPTTALAAAGQQAGGLKRASSSAGTGASGGKKRKAAELRLPDKPYHILPESPLFVEIQDVERRVDQAITKKRAELQELYVGLSRDLPRKGENAAGSARKRLRVYIYSQHFNQPRAEGQPASAPTSTAPDEPSSWALNIYGKLIDPGDDKTHPGGGGNPGTDLPSMKHHFSHFLKSLTITLDKTQYPGKAGVVSWQRGKHDREPHNLFQVRRLGDKPVKAKIGMEMWHSPELYEVPEAMEKLLTLPSGEGRGLYSMAYICTALWNYGTVNTGVIGEPPDQKVQFDAPLAAAFGLSPEEAAHPVALSRLPELLKKVLSPPKPLSLEYEVDVTAGSTGKPICLDLHVEVPLSFEGTSGAPPEWLKTMRGKLDKELEAVDHAVATTVGRFREHRRRHTVLMAFSIDPVRTIEELVAAQGKELRLAVSKEAEAVEVMKLSDLFNEKWTQDAILKYLGKKQAQEAAAAVIGQQMAQAAAVVQTQWNAAIMARAAMVAGQQNQQNNNAAQAQQAAGPQQQVAAEAAPAQAQEQPAEPAAAPAAQR